MRANLNWMSAQSIFCRWSVAAIAGAVVLSSCGYDPPDHDSGPSTSTSGLPETSGLPRQSEPRVTSPCSPPGSGISHATLMATPDSTDVVVATGWRGDCGMTSDFQVMDACSAVVRGRGRLDVPPRSYARSAYLNDRWLLSGGFDWFQPHNVYGDLYSLKSAPFVLDSRTHTDKSIEPVRLGDPPFEPREAHGLVSLGASLFMYGGVTYANPELSAGISGENKSGLRTFSDVWRSDDGGSSWVRMLDRAPWTPRRSFGFGALGDEMFLFGGINDESGQVFHDVWSSPDGRKWRLVSKSSPWTPRYSLGTGFSEEELLVVGGTDLRRDFADVWRSKDGKKWVQLTASTDFTPRAGAVFWSGRCDGERSRLVGSGLGPTRVGDRRWLSDFCLIQAGAGKCMTPED